jgi:hypothetical protein
MKFKTLLPAAIVFFLISTMFAADKTILIELRVPKTAEVGHGSIEFVGEHTSQSYQLMQTKLTADGTTNIFQHSFIIYTSLYKERRFGIVVWPDSPPNMTAQLFPLPIGANPKATIKWSKWQKPDYIENSKKAGDNFMDDVKSADRSTNIPPNCFEVRYKIEDAK